MEILSPPKMKVVRCIDIAFLGGTPLSLNIDESVGDTYETVGDYSIATFHNLDGTVRNIVKVHHHNLLFTGEQVTLVPVLDPKNNPVTQFVASLEKDQRPANSGVKE